VRYNLRARLAPFLLEIAQLGVGVEASLLRKLWEENWRLYRLSGSDFGMVLNENDRELIEACQRGGQDAFAVLFEANKDKVYSLALRYAGDPAAAMDIAQDTFLKLLSRIQQFRCDANFDTWLYRLVVNSCLDYQRRRRRLAPIVEGLLDMVCAARDTVLHRLVREEREEEVQEVIGKLPPEQRIVILLRYTEDLPYEHIAEILGCSRGTVASRLNRAHKALEKRLSHFRHEGGSARG
jgi:RNA polymerase sigma-70 factor (ECF subfamily)